jgi:hypothetical protein
LLRLQTAAGSAHAALGIIHGLLEGIIFPAKDVITVLSVSGGIAGAQDERLRPCVTLLLKFQAFFRADIPSSGHSALLLKAVVSQTI